MDKKLHSILNPHASWYNDEGEEKNLLAKKALYEFYEELKKYKLSKTYAKRYNFPLHISYLSHLIELKKAFMEQKYMRACNELVSLMYYEPFFQGRIYHNVLKLLKAEMV